MNTHVLLYQFQLGKLTGYWLYLFELLICWHLSQEWAARLITNHDQSSLDIETYLILIFWHAVLWRPMMSALLSEQSGIFIGQEFAETQQSEGRMFSEMRFQMAKIAFRCQNTLQGFANGMNLVKSKVPYCLTTSP